jgi:hypothetical protein
MNFEEFRAAYENNSFREKISISCSVDGCENQAITNKDSAARNIKKNGVFKCRTCCYTEEGRKKISVTNSYKRSPETRQKMAEAKKEFYETEKGKELKKKLSIMTAENHSVHKYDKAKRRGVFESQKTGRKLSYDSSCELRLCWLIDSNEQVLDFETQLLFQINGRGRCLDCLIAYKSGKKKAIEIKPKKRLDEFKDQIEDSRKYALQNGWDFQVMTEYDLGMTCSQIRLWADDYRTKSTGIDYHAYRKEINKNKAQKYYKNHIAGNTVEIYCEYCKENHNPLKLTYDRNIKRNGRYICEREGGSISGKRPKKKKINPYENEGKKQCDNCEKILLIEEFSKGKNICKVCRAKKYKENYDKKQ